METFSERNKILPPKNIQLNGIDDDLRIRIWNIVNIALFHEKAYGFDSFTYEEEDLIEEIWINLFNKDVDSLGREHQLKNNFKKIFFASEWHILYSLIEIILKRKREKYYSIEEITNAFNLVFEKENSGYRVINDIVSPITTETEINEIKKSLKLDNKYYSVTEHFNTALKLLSDKKSPDYRNSAKESISAVESLGKIITEDKKATLGKALDIINQKINLHPGLTNGFKSIYGYTSDDSGIRHALLEKDNITYEDALFFLVSCSSFVNYLISKFENKTN